MRKRILTPLTLAVASLQSVAGQADNANTTTPIWALASKLEAGSSTICGQTFEDANATGIYYINPNVLQGPQVGQQNTGRTQDSGIAVTVNSAPNVGNSTSNATSSSYSLWYNTFGANYTGDFTLGYDVCAILGFSLNYNTLLRGQSGDGTCSSALDTPCINALAAVTEQHADWLTTPSTIGPGSNLTNTSLPGLCNTLAGNLRDSFPDECSYFFDHSAVQALGFPLTSNGQNYKTVLNPNCTLNSTWQNAVSVYNNNSQIVYTEWVQAVTPIIFVFMPVADFVEDVATTRIPSSKAEISCLHINEINEGSFDPDPLPAPVPIAYNATSTPAPAPQPTTSPSPTASPDSGLETGSIVGIVVGSVCGVALIVIAVLVVILRRRRKARKASAQRDADAAGGLGTKAELHGESTNRHSGSKFTELGLGETVHEVSAGERHQLPATVEEGGKSEPLELDGEGGEKLKDGRREAGGRAELP